MGGKQERHLKDEDQTLIGVGYSRQSRKANHNLKSPAANECIIR